MRKIFTICVFIFISFLFSSTSVGAYGECTKYGPMAMYNSYSGTCSCMSGYVFDDSFPGGSYCVDADIICHDKYGYNSRYDSLDKSCECSYGYVWGKDSIGRTRCVSPDSLCTEQLGTMSRYDSLSDKCECLSGYVISSGQCTYGNQVCRSKHGMYSDYNSLDNTCECDDGYTLNDNKQCVEKQNNVYFTLKELDTDNKKAIIKSDYDYRYYLITYNAGCYALSFNRYLNHQIVVNLGTDLYLDTWDKIVLQDDNETCDITHKELVDSNTTLEPEEEKITYTSRPITYSSPTPSIKTTANSKGNDYIVSDSEVLSMNSFGILKAPATFRKCPSTECTVIRYYAETSRLLITGSNKSGDWYRVMGTTDAGGTGQEITGWIYKTLFGEILINNNVSSASVSIKEIKKEEGSWFWRFIGWISN